MLTDKDISSNKKLLYEHTGAIGDEAKGQNYDHPWNER